MTYTMVSSKVVMTLMTRNGELHMRNRKEMTIRVASRYLKEAGILSNIIDFFSESPREKEQLKKRPVFDTSKAWITFGMYGTSTGEVSHKLKLKGEDWNN